jgi:hypothetical protein
MAIDYVRFVRVTTRCAEVGTDPGISSIVGLIYKETAEAPMKAFLEASTAVDNATSAFAKENKEALAALSKLDGPYRVARSAVVAVLPETVLPDTLKTQPTDTDKLIAIERLLDVIDDNVGTPWANALLVGEFGQQAPKTVKELTEAIAANKTHAKAVTARAAAYGPAYEAYLPFKRVVRDALGPASKEYRRIHLRASPGGGKQDDGEPEGEAIGNAGNNAAGNAGAGAAAPDKADDAPPKGGAQPPA